MRFYSIPFTAACFLVASHTAYAHGFEWGIENNVVEVMQPNPHPVQPMSRIGANYIATVGMDFYYPTGSQSPLLQSVRVQQVWISEGLSGTRAGGGTTFCRSGCVNFVDLTALNAHQHLNFVASMPGIYVWDIQGTQGINAVGQPVADMPYAFRIYMQAGTLNRIHGSVQPAEQYAGVLYDLMLTVQLKANGAVLAESRMPPNNRALYPYLVGFTQNGTYDVVAKLDKHLSRKVTMTLESLAQVNWEFPFLGDVNNDDTIDDSDLLQLLFDFGTNETRSDLNGDGVVDDSDLLIILFNFGSTGEGRQ
jgi:hypothetical protein